MRDSAGFGGSFRFFTDNGTGAQIYGAEFDGSVRLTEAWSLRGNLGLMRSDLDVFTLQNGRTAGGRELAATPSYTYSTSLKYRAGATGWLGQFEIAGRGAFFQSNSHDAELSGYSRINLSLGYAFENLEVRLWVKNLGDRDYEERVFFFGNDPDLGFAPTRYTAQADPRQAGVTVRWNW